MRIALGINIGGTNISVGLVNELGRILLRKTIPAQASQGGPALLRRVVRLAKDTIRNRAILGIGACMPGQIDPNKGMPLAPTPNIPGWARLPIKKALSGLGLPVHIENDANVAALGEQYCGAGRGVKNLILLTLGTGVGGGIIIDGKIYRGSFCYAGEVGHVPVPIPPWHKVRCGCGNYGCLETVASATGVVRRMRDRMHETGESKASCKDRRKSNKITAKKIFDLARRGRKLELEVVKETGWYLGVAIAGLINVLDPELVIIGGKMSEAGDILMNQIRLNVRGRTMPSKSKCPRIVRAKLGGDAGLIGAAALVFSHE
ncbi:MAG: ROK family protein [Candidatus Brocadiia bacterium]